MNASELNSIWRNLPIEPHEVLRKYPLVVSMGSNNIGGLQEGWLLGETKGEIRLADPSVAGTFITGTKISVDVYAVNMVTGSAQVNAGDIHTLPRDATVAVTPLLTGCTVGIKRDGTAMFHKQPDNSSRQSGSALQKAMKDSFGSDYRCFGADDYVTASFCTVVAVNVGGWEFYRQRLNGGGFNGRSVAGVSQIGL